MSKLLAVVVVDPISSGQYYGGEIQRSGYLSIALISVKKLSEAVRHLQKLNEFECIIYAEGVEEAVQALSRFNVRAVIPGSDIGTRLSDALGTRFGLISNRLESSPVRFNKRELKKQLLAKGVAATKSWGIRLEKLDTDPCPQFEYPLVVKPAQGTGSRNVKICRNYSDLYAAVQAVQRNKEAQTEEERCALVEQYLEGDEYFVVTANCGMSGYKRMLCFAIYEKLEVNGNPSIYKNIRSLPLDDKRGAVAFSYVSMVNDAIEFVWGVNDVELKLGSDGPLIIEQNGRLPGANVPRLIEVCSGVNCYSLSLDIYLGLPLGDTKSVAFSKHFCICCLICDVSGVVKDISGLDLVKSLESFYMMELYVSEGCFVEQTRDFLSSWGMVYLVHESRDVLTEDSESVHRFLKLNYD